MSSSQQEDKYALHAAAREGKVTTNPKLSQRKDDDGRLPIHWAASSNQHAILLLLSQQKTFDPDVEDDMGWTPLMIAASVKDGEAIVDVLLQRGADVDQKKRPALRRLQEQPRGSPQAFAHKPPASSRVRDKRGQYPLHRAAAVGSTPMVKLLLEHRSPLNATDVAGYTALHHAVAEGHGDTAIELLKAGAETDKRDTDGYLALDLAPDKQVRKYIERAAENEGIEL
ncbi:ankyrin repeat-containing domain protein [Astrocystis sublimbata]|nr:ankyrin repeat-containing domain protein [Astrocystis sublimbata]